MHVSLYCSYIKNLQGNTKMIKTSDICMNYNEPLKVMLSYASINMCSKMQHVLFL